VGDKVKAKVRSYSIRLGQDVQTRVCRQDAGYVFSVVSRESGFQTVVARASRPCVGCTIRTGGTPVRLEFGRFSLDSFFRMA
jgi:hypothetical protein